MPDKISWCWFLSNRKFFPCTEKHWQHNSDLFIHLTGSRRTCSDHSRIFQALRIRERQWRCARRCRGHRRIPPRGWCVLESATIMSIRASMLVKWRGVFPELLVLMENLFSFYTRKLFFSLWVYGELVAVVFKMSVQNDGILRLRNLNCSWIPKTSSYQHSHSFSSGKSLSLRCRSDWVSFARRIQGDARPASSKMNPTHCNGFPMKLNFLRSRLKIRLFSESCNSARRLFLSHSLSMLLPDRKCVKWRDCDPDCKHYMDHTISFALQRTSQPLWDCTFVRSMTS